MPTRHEVESPVVGTVLELPAPPGTEVDAGAEIAVIESMKMEIPVVAPMRGRVTNVEVVIGQSVQAGDRLLTLEC